jgi:hypothetical protein
MLAVLGLGRRKKEGPAFKFKPGSRTTRILRQLIAGEVIGGREAVQITRTHNGDRDLRFVKQMLRRHGVLFTEVLKDLGGGRTLIKVRLPRDQRAKAMGLLSS